MRRLGRRLLAVLTYGPWYCTQCGAQYSTDAEGAAHMAAAHS